MSTDLDIYPAMSHVRNLIVLWDLCLKGFQWILPLLVDLQCHPQELLWSILPASRIAPSLDRDRGLVGIDMMRSAHDSLCYHRGLFYPACLFHGALSWDQLWGFFNNSFEDFRVQL